MGNAARAHGGTSAAELKGCAGVPFLTVRWLGALLPLLMTLTVVIAGLVEAARIGGFVRQPDEGTAAHLFQILMPAQIPIIALFAATQLPRHPMWTRWVLALQIGAAAALFAAVFSLRL